MRPGWLLCLLGLLLVPAGLTAQDYPRPAVDLPLLIQELVARPENEDLNYEDLYENLLQN